MALMGPVTPRPPMGDPGGASVGIIFPPADIRGIIDKTAAFVAKNGVEFEHRVLREQSNQKFAFLQATNPYRPYYEMKVKEFQTGQEGTTAPSVPQAILDMRKKEEQKIKKKEQLLMLTQHGDKSLEIRPPEPDQFSLIHPIIAPVDVDIIKLTAQFVARNGQKFLMGLTQRERNNPQFEFLQPTHFLFKYFTSLVDSYTKCLLPEKSAVERLQQNVSEDGVSRLAERFHRRYQWEAEQEAQRQEKERQAEEERVQMQNIDWHDFVVVEAIDFTEEDETVDLPPPLDFSAGGKPRSVPTPLAQGKRSVIDKDRLIRDDMEMDIEESEAAQVDNTSRQEEAVGALPPMRRAPEAPSTFPVPLPMPQGVPPSEAEPSAFAPPLPTAPLQQDLPAQPATAADEEVLVLQDYKRQPRRRPAAAGGQMQRCPITGQLIRASEMSNHLRILLLDPKWKEQKDKLLDRAKKETALAPEFDVETNLAQFVVKRPDLFGSVEDEIQTHTAEILPDLTVFDASVLVSQVYDPTRGTAPMPFPAPPPLPAGIPVPALPGLPAPRVIPPPPPPDQPDAKRVKTGEENSSNEAAAANPPPPPEDDNNVANDKE